jgi:hypothetical protein
MKTTLEFADSSGSESIAGQIEGYEGPVPAVGEIVYLDMAAKFRVVQRVSYYLSASPGVLDDFRREVKVSLHCERVHDR